MRQSNNMQLQATLLNYLMILTFTTYAVSSLEIEQITWYPTYHLASPLGSMNDPNGLIYYNEFYHAFFQYNPTNNVSGTKYWGHAISKDMISWDYLPIAIRPSLPDDTEGIFSGSVVILDGKLTAIYTGVSMNISVQRQMVAVSNDGIRFEKRGVVLKKDGDEANFRDPKAWYQNGSWWVVIGSESKDNKGEVLLYSSKNFFNWTYEGVLAQADESLGFMWESPDFFTLDGKQILVFSPHGVKKEGYNFQNLYQTGYFVGSWEPGKNYTIEKGFREIDHGHDFYASKSFLAPDGRRIQISWLDMWEYAENFTGWNGMMTIPRELSLNKNGDLISKPIKEIRQKRIIKLDNEELSSCNKSSYTIKDNVFNSEILIEYNLLSSNSTKAQLILKENSTKEEGVAIYIDSVQGRIFLERYYPEDHIQKTNRSVPFDHSLPNLFLDIFVDSSSIEVFVNNGVAVMSSRIYPNNDQRDLSLFAADDGCAHINSVVVYDIVKI